MSNLTFQQAVEQIKNNLDIVEVISRHVVLKKTGRTFLGLCPFHNEKTPSFTVTPSRQIFKCFGCNEGGDVLTFLQKISNQSFGDVIKEQAEIFNIELPKSHDGKNFETNKKEKEDLISAVKNAMEFYHKNLLKNDSALEYLEKRGITEVAIGKFFLGLSPNTMFELKDYLRSPEGGSFTNDQLLKAGLIIAKDNDYIDRFRNRIMIPIFDVNSNPIAFGARAIADNQNPKYLNSPDSTIYNKSNIMFGLNYAKDAIREEDSVIIMEGYFDVISAQINGVKNTVASCGTALTPQQVKLLSRYTMSRKIYLAFDSDDAGIKAASSGADVIRNIFENLGDIKQYDSSYSDISPSVCEIRVVSQISGKDPDEYIREFGADEYKKQVQNSPLLLDFQIEQTFKKAPKKPTAQEKNELVHQLVEILIQIKNSVILAEYIKNIAYKLNLEEKILKRQVDIALSTKNSSNITKDEDKIVNIKYQKNSLEEIYSKVESNIIKLALSADTIEKRVYLKQSIQGFNPKNEVHIEIVTQIDKLLNKVNNVSDIAKKLLAVFCSSNETQKYLTDLIYYAREFENLNYDDFVQAIGETFERLNNLNKLKSKNKIRQKYKNTDITEDEQIKISQEIYEQFGYRRN